MTYSYTLTKPFDDALFEDLVLLQNPGKKGLMSFLIGDGLVGWPAKRDISKEQCTKPENKVACWEATEAAVGPFF